MNLVLACLPSLNKAQDFALKGGTAINLFLRPDYPRISVDLDLTYLPIQDRSQSLSGIQDGLKIIGAAIAHAHPQVQIKENYSKNNKVISRLDVSLNNTSIKIEPNFILRGSVFAPSKMNVSQKVASTYNSSPVGINVASLADVYAGKICAALDRQHPRDLFDAKLLLEDIGVTQDIKNAFLIYLSSHNRPMHELLEPHLLDQKNAFDVEFKGMENIAVSYDELIKARLDLITALKKAITSDDKEFLLSICSGEPNWSKTPLGNLEKLPGIQWKLINIGVMDKAKHNLMVDNLIRVLSTYG